MTDGGRSGGAAAAREVRGDRAERPDDRVGLGRRAAAGRPLQAGGGGVSPGAAGVPNDRDTWRNLGRTLYLDQKFEESLEAYDNVLAIDPEDRVSHYHRMLNFKALGKEAEAAEAEKAYLKYQIDESADAVTNDYRHKNLDANPRDQPDPRPRARAAPAAAALTPNC
jgi:tetratricopeptide (TPR) repeat protein